MDCKEFEAHLEPLLDGQLDRQVEARCLAHASTCPSCGELLIAVEGDPASSPSRARPELVEAILERTSGAACGQARERLPAYVDREVSDGDRELIDLHLETCAACSRLVATLSRLQHELPRLAELPVDERFTGQVLAATLPVSKRMERWWTGRWTRWVHRPRFAMEAAYIGSLILLLVLGAFSTPVAALPQKGVDLIQPEPGSRSVWVQANEGLGTFWEGFASLLERAENDPATNEDAS